MNPNNLPNPPEPATTQSPKSENQKTESPSKAENSPKPENPSSSLFSALSRRLEPVPEPALVFSPLAWLKLQFFLHAGDTEIGGFGISRDDDLLYIEEFVTVKQAVSGATVEFDDTAVADYFDSCVDRGLPPQRFARVWMHTHPGESPQPSFTDEQTFERAFGRCDWSIMFILGRSGRTYCRLSFAAGPGGQIQLPVRVDWESWPELVAHEGAALPELFDRWIAEYCANIQEVELLPVGIPPARNPAADAANSWNFSPDLPDRAAWAEDAWTGEEVMMP